MSSVSGELAGELFVGSMIAGIGVATFLIRFAPIALLARLELPAWLTQALRYVPPAVMAAIIAPPLFFADGAPTIDPNLPRIIAAARDEGVQLRRILLTHGHIDHAGGTRALADQLKLPIEGPHPDDQFWIDQIATGARSRAQVRQDFIASAEFTNRVAAIIADGCLP